MRMFREKRKVRDLDSNSSLYYVKMKLPMINMRESVARRTITKLDDGSWIHLMHSTVDDEFPITDDIIRTEFY